ncbi:MAG: T9SS type A sorting domain-containing protein, partial [Calditrichales bacterium]|nr:T9SS type A sorting domain-containing protein [Calditrichales bacterium]
GQAEMNDYSIAQEIEAQNSGDAPLYGEVNVSNVHVSLYPYWIRYFIDPGATDTISIKLRPLIKEQINSNIDFNEGNADNQGIQIPFAIEGVRELGLDANNIDMWIHPNGVFAYNYQFRDSGLEWPIYSEKYVVYSSGVWVGAKVGEEIHTAISAKSSGIEEFAPGPIDESGQAADPTDPRFRVYKIHLGDNNSNPDYAEWPADLGAPVDENGNPKHLGDQTIFVVYNDLNEDNHSRTGSTPLCAEIQQTVFAWDDEGALGNTLFLRFKVINKSNDVWEDTYFALWSEPDVGYCGDYLVGIDVDKNMGYAYNGSNQDDNYRSGPPAVGYDILKGAYYTKPIQAFAYYDYTLPDEFNEPQTGPECYNYLQGLNRYGNPYFDTVANKDTVFALNGDPVAETGWTDSNKGDRRFLLSTGPFDLHPGQAKEIVAAIIVIRDSTGNDRDYLNSITALRSASDIIQAKFDEGDLFGGALENVTVEEISAGDTVTVDDLENSGAQLNVTAGEEGATVEIASYIDAPPGADEIQHSAIHGVGKYMDVLVNGDIEWPIDIKIYYTQNDLDEAGVLEDDLEGVYYWHNVEPEDWYLYSKSMIMGDDPVDIYPDSSETGIVKNPDGTYLGYVWAKAYHLTMMRIGTKLDSALIGIHPEEPNITSDFQLKQNYPNPFNPVTTIEYSLPVQSTVNLSVYSILGARISTLDFGIKASGVHRLQWDASSFPSGIYFVKVQCISLVNNSEFIDIKKMILMK